MRNNILASIALFGTYRQKNLDTYDLVAQFITATIAQKEYTSFTAITMKQDLKDLFHIDIPTGVIKSVSKNRIANVTLNNSIFSCPRKPKDEIEQEYKNLSEEYDVLFSTLLEFVKARLLENDYTDDDIKAYFADYLVDNYSSEHRLNNLFAAFISENKSSADIRQKIDLLSSGLISYNGLRYTDRAGTSGAWTDKLTVYLDTEFLFSCAGYNGEYYQQVFNELYDLIREVNASHRRRSKKEEDLIILKYLRDTREVYSSIFASIKQLIDTKSVPDPSRKAMMKIYQESQSVFDVDIHKSKIDTEIQETYHIQYDSNDYTNLVTDGRYVIFDAETVTDLDRNYNPENDEIIKRKIDYVSRVLTIINGLRGDKDVQVFEQCKVVFLTGSRIGRGASVAVRNATKKAIPLASDIDFFVSRLWFKLNKQLSSNAIPVSLDIVARAQAVLTKEVTLKVRSFYDRLVKSDMPEAQKKVLYATLKDAEEFLEPYNESSSDEVLTFIEYSSMDELMEAYHSMKRKAAEADKKDKELSDTKEQLAQKEEENADLKKNIAEKEQDHQKRQTDAFKQNMRLTKTNKCLIAAVVLLVIALVVALLL